jgi:hypothetical protein
VVQHDNPAGVTGPKSVCGKVVAVQSGTPPRKSLAGTDGYLPPAEEARSRINGAVAAMMAPPMSSRGST